MKISYVDEGLVEYFNLGISERYEVVPSNKNIAYRFFTFEIGTELKKVE